MNRKISALERQLLQIKDADIRVSILQQGIEAVDRGLHIGGAFSAVVPLVSLFYSGVIEIDVEDPTRPGQDLFVLSKGHAVAALASVMADLGYFDRSILKNSRSQESILNGHPGPLLPGVPIATGPEGHGMPVAQGLALAGRNEPEFDVYCLTGDGELQAGMIWEAVMFAGQTGVDNFCVLVDHNGGQLDNPRALAFPMKNIESWFASFGWNVLAVDARDYRNVVAALHTFKYDTRNGKPTAIICHGTKGWGGFSDLCVSHKLTLAPEMVAEEIRQQTRRRDLRVEKLLNLVERLSADEKTALSARTEALGYSLDTERGEMNPGKRTVLTRPASPRDKVVPGDTGNLPMLEPGREYAADVVIRECMREYGRSGRVVTVDSDLASTSGLQPGLSRVNATRALNVGVAETNMISIGEAYAALGYNVWVSTFCPFFDWRVMRRIAIGYQERRESIEAGLWLSDGHNLDMVFLATAANFETRTNGATHMGNDDALLFSEIACLSVVDISCPNQLLAFIRWVMEGNRGLIYARILRAPSPVIYPRDTTFDLGRSHLPYTLTGKEAAVIVSSGRGVYEAITARESLEKRGISTGVVDMHSFDRELLEQILDRDVLIVFAEQNNGILWKYAREELNVDGAAATVIARNTRGADGRRQFLHSATYEQLLESHGLSGEQLARTVESALA